MMINQNLMKKIKYSLMLLPAFVLLTLAFCFRQPVFDNDQSLTPTILDVLEYYHYQPKMIDDKFSKDLFDLYIKRLDNDKRFFLKNEIDSLSTYKDKLDDQAKAGKFEFFDKINAMYIIRVARSEKWVNEYLSKPYDFTAKEYLDFDEEHPSFLNSESELKEFWRKNLKRQVLERLSNKMDIQEKAQIKKDTFVKIKPYDSLEAESRREVAKSHKTWFNNIRKFNRKDMVSMYVNCITEIFDLHTNYFPPADKENFDIRMSGKLEGIGASLQEKDGFLKVAAIVPGSPSYKQGQLKAGDIILKVAQGAAEPVDISNMKMDDAIQLIRGKKGTEVRLTVKKPDESIVIIPIIRDVVIMEDTYAKSMIIDNEGVKYGYINLPSFYIDMNDNGGRSCFIDVANEIKKLKADSVKGIILDLRNNGGGSLDDVVKMGGLFIDKGPMCLVKNKLGQPEMKSDRDNGALWEGPLTIMVNESSASASEILAAAMQDYKRATIIGTPTYGKGTVQTFIDLDQGSGRTQADLLGSVKVTIQKFYRINGSTTQLMGVTPDVIIPDRYRYLDFGEKDQDYALGADKISQAPYTVSEWANKVKEAASKGNKRIASNSLFQEIESFAKKVEKMDERTRFTLNLEEYRAETKQNELDNKKYDELMKSIQALKIYNTKKDDASLSVDDTKKKVKADWNKAFEKDIYIQEAVKVLKDLN